MPIISRNFARKKRSVKNNNFKKLNPSEIKVGFDEIIGHNECKKDLGNILQFLEKPELYAQYGIIPYCKYLIIGDEGVGKSTLACSVAKKANVPIYVVEPSFFYDTERVLDQIDILFEEIRQLQNDNCNCMLLFKNIEYFSGMPAEILHPILEKIVSYFREMPQLVAFATLSTMVSCEISKSLLDPPAFSKLITLSFPEVKVREEILKFLLKEIPVEEGFDIHRLALETYQMGFGDIKNIVRDSILLFMCNKQDKLSYHNFAEALAQSNFGYAKNKLNEGERLATARHEAGHVVAGYYSAPDTYRISKVEITPRSFYAGITQETLDEEKVGYFKEELESKIIGIFGGMASEELYYNSTTTGVVNDLEQATGIAIAIFKQYGMSDKVGPICLVFESETFGKLNREADDEIQKFLKEMYDRAKELIKKYADALEALTNALLANEVLYSDEIMEILRKYDK